MTTYAELPFEYLRTCRVCKKLIDDPRTEVKYSVRHYAHPDCFIGKFGREIVTMIPTWKLEMLPYKPLQNHGLLQFVRDHVAAKKEATNA